MKKFREYKYEIAAAVICILLLWGLAAGKQGFHMDELLSFQLSNAEFNPWIVSTQPEGRLARFVHNEIDGENLRETLGNLAAVIGDVLENRGNSKLLTYKAEVWPEPVWITAGQFRDYIEVNRGDAFNYLSVYFNVKDDNHPPLHFMLLHTVSSFFQGKAEAWMGCLINLGAVAGILILLVKSGRLLAEALGLEEYSHHVGVLSVLFYGLSAGAGATVLLIRMYGLLTLWCMAYFYLVIKKWRDRSFERKNGKLMLVAMLGFWTQYFFLFYCILLAGLLCVLLLREGRKKELWSFVRSMLIAAAVGIAVFPFSIADVFSSGRGVEALENLSSGLRGYGSRLVGFFQIMWERTFTPWFWIFLALAAAVALVWRFSGGLFPLLRGGAGHGEKGGCNVPEAGNNGFPDTTAEKDIDVRRGRAAYFWLLLLPPIGYFLLAARMSPYLVDRYVMPLFPFAALTVGLAFPAVLRGLASGCRKMQGKKIILTGCMLAVLLQAAGILGDGSREYLYAGYALQEEMAESLADYSCICVYEGVGYYENLKEFTHYEKTLLVTPAQLAERQDRESIEALDKVAVLIKCDEVELSQVLEIMRETYGFSVDKWGWRERGVHGDVLCLMRRDVAAEGK